MHWVGSYPEPFVFPTEVGNMNTRDVGPRGVHALGWQLSRAICLLYSGWEHEH